MSLESGDSLDEAFLAALLLTGSVERAEAAVLDGIATWDHQSTPATLVLETVKASVPFASERREHALLILPREMKRVLGLPAQLRCCFVLRTLVGLTPIVCSEILNLDLHVIEEFTQAALHELAFGDCQGSQITRIRCAERRNNVHAQSR